MEPLSIKQQNEQLAFKRFAQRLGTVLLWTEISSREPPEPDLLCIHVEEGPIAFELVSLTDPAIAERQAAGSKAYIDVLNTSDPSEEIVRSKLQKGYETTAPYVELLIYTDGQIITTDDAIIPTIRPLFDSIAHPFRRIWFMGQYETLCLWEMG